MQHSGNCKTVAGTVRGLYKHFRFMIANTPMQKFITLTGAVAPLPMINVDTDMIIPKQFLKTIKRTGLGANLFHEMRFDYDGQSVPGFVLNREPYKAAQILVSGANFGCGSSREHAPWALLDYGIRCVIAPSFADIFYNNCFKNGILPVVLEQALVDRLMAQAEAHPGVAMTVDLPRQVLVDADGQEIPFMVDGFRKHCLLEGLDDIGLTLQQEGAIASYEARVRQQQPWVIGA
jgi:3-isopropylmalate/(R)-2-methylmalate dehydratase small subunit